MGARRESPISIGGAYVPLSKTVIVFVIDRLGEVNSRFGCGPDGKKVRVSRYWSEVPLKNPD
jgi:hypothetical protein